MSKFRRPETPEETGSEVTTTISHSFEVPDKPRMAELVRLGLTVGEVQSLAAAGMTHTDIAEVAQAQADAKAAAVAQQIDAQREGTQAAIEATKPRVASREDFEYEHKSAFNPLGELHHKRPGLSVPMFWGVLSEEDNKPPIPLYEIEAQQTTFDEQVLLNQIAAQRGTLEMNDGTLQPYEVYVQRDRVSHAPIKLVIGLPKVQYEKANRNSLPPLKKLARELIEKQTAQVA